jgi:hypothetical protein
LPRCPPSISSAAPWFPFGSRHDWELASWFAKSRNTKDSIEAYFQNPEFDKAARAEKGTIRNYRGLMQAVYDIPFGIPNSDHWQSLQITVAAQVQGGKPETHTLLYRPIQQCLEFLLGHRPFASDLAWAPVRKSYGRDGARVYDEMHTGDWWWETQTHLPPGATIVPLQIATDKTLMTTLSGDRTAWPVYMTIGNLPRRVRRKQTSPALLLIGMLPISKEVTKSSDPDMAYSIKSDLYHMAMNAILERL